MCAGASTGITTTIDRDAFSSVTGLIGDVPANSLVVQRVAPAQSDSSCPGSSVDLDSSSS